MGSVVPGTLGLCLGLVRLEPNRFTGGAGRTLFEGPSMGVGRCRFHLGEAPGGGSVAQEGRRARCDRGLGETGLETWTMKMRSRRRGWSGFWTGWRKRG